MSTNRIYHQEWLADPGTIMGLEIIPADTTALDSPEIITIPPEITFALGSVKYAYDYGSNGVVQWQKTPNLTLKMDMGEFGVSAEMRDLRAALLAPYSTTYHFDLGGTEPESKRAFRTSNVWRLYVRFEGHPYGDDYRHYFFFGAQRSQPGRRGAFREIGTEAASADTEFTLVHLGRAILEQCKPYHLARRMFNHRSPVGDSAIIFDRLYRDASRVYFKGQAWETSPWPLMRDWRWIHLFAELRLLARQAARAYTRNPAFALTFGGTGGTVVDGTTVSSPFDFVTLFEWRGDTTIGPGDALTFGDWTFTGAWWNSNTSGTEADYRGGLLVDDGKRDSSQSFFRFRNCWDLLEVLTKQSPSKARFLELAGSLEIRWDPLFRNAWTDQPAVLVPHAIAISEIEGSDIEYEEHGRSIAGAKSIIPGMDGDDWAEVASDLVGVESEEEISTRFLLHNMPSVGQSKEAYQRYNAGGSLQLHPVTAINGQHAGMCVRLLCPWQIHYWKRVQAPDGTFLLNDARPIVPYPVVMIRDHFPEVVPVQTYGEHPVFTTWTTGDIIAKLREWWSTQRADMLISQRESCLPFAIAGRNMLWFGLRSLDAASQISYTQVPLPLSRVLPSHMGEIYKIGDGTANSFLVDETYASTLKIDTALLIELEISTKTAATKCELLHINRTIT